MSRITLVRGAEAMPGEPILAGVRRFLFGLFDGWSKNDLWRHLGDGAHEMMNQLLEAFGE